MKRRITILQADFNHVSILSYLITKGILVNFNCADGYCGVCHSTLVSGEVKSVKDEIAFKPKGDILICSCIPVSDIVIELN